MSRVEPNRNIYVGHRYVPKIFGEWDNQNEYEGLSIVTYQGGSYTSKKRVPVGIDILNEEFWVITGNYNAQVEEYRQDVKNVKDDLILTNEYVDQSVTELKKDVDDSIQENKDFVNDSMDQSREELRTHALNIETFGAVSLDIDPSFDSSESIINALNYADSNGISDILIPNKEFGIANPIPLKTGIKLKTQSGSLKVLESSNWVENHPGRAVVELISVHNVNIKNLKIEGNITDSHNATMGILLMNTHSNVFEGVHVKNFGAVNSIPSNGLIRGLSRDSVTEFNTSVPEVFKNVTGAVKNNTFNNCIIELTKDVKSSFGVRMLTDWESKKQPESVLNKLENNSFNNCRFIGEFNWNHLEYAGSGTINNTVDNCYFTGNSLTAIDFDKGASYNTANNNYIENVGLPSSQSSNTNIHLAVINVHGFGNDMPSDGNIITNNKIFNSDNINTRDHSANACVIGVLQANNNLFENNIINGLNNNVRGSAFNIGHDSTNNKFISNDIKSTHTGVLTNYNSSTHKDNKFINNSFSDVVRGIILGGIDDSELEGIEISDNKIILNNTDFNYGIQVTTVAKNPKIKNNTVYNGAEGITVASDLAIIDGNIVINSQSRSFRVSSNDKSYLINNVSINPGTDDLAFANRRPIMYGNDFRRTINNGGITSFNDTAPLDGTWERGDRVYATVPVSGGFIGWVCTTSGTPGTWKGFGNIEE